MSHGQFSNGGSAPILATAFAIILFGFCASVNAQNINYNTWNTELYHDLLDASSPDSIPPRTKSSPLELDGDERLLFWGYAVHHNRGSGDN
jgi:hypothetical protein